MSHLVGSQISVEVVAADINPAVLAFEYACYPVYARGMQLAPCRAVIVQQTLKVCHEDGAILIAQNIEAAVVGVVFLSGKGAHERSCLHACDME